MLFLVRVVAISNVYDVFTATQNDYTKQLISHDAQNFELPEEVIHPINKVCVTNRGGLIALNSSTNTDECGVCWVYKINFFII